MYEFKTTAGFQVLSGEKPTRFSELLHNPLIHINLRENGEM